MFQYMLVWNFYMVPKTFWFNFFPNSVWIYAGHVKLSHLFIRFIFCFTAVKFLIPHKHHYFSLHFDNIVFSQPLTLQSLFASGMSVCSPKFQGFYFDDKPDPPTTDLFLIFPIFIRPNIYGAFLSKSRSLISHIPLHSFHKRFLVFQIRFHELIVKLFQIILNSEDLHKPDEGFSISLVIILYIGSCLSNQMVSLADSWEDVP